MPSIDNIVISYPDFRLNDVIDPEQFDVNNGEIVDKLNEVVNGLNNINLLAGHIIFDKYGAQMPTRNQLKFGNSTVTYDDNTITVNGIQGDVGPQGPQGIQGIQGVIGKTIVPSIDVNGIMSFTVQDTAIAPNSVSVRGPQGPQGVQGLQGLVGANGPQGIQGIQGVQGIQGAKGDQGATGPAGAQGPIGLTGPTGAQGATGIQGPVGATGQTGSQGPIGPQGIQGNDGADGRSFTIQDIYSTLGELKLAYPTGNEFAYQVSADSCIYIWSENENDWVSLGQLQGPQGPQGIQGIQGPQGEAGVDGATGPQGPQGPIGPQGPQGETGPQGIQGVKGDTGVQGIQGIQGPAGPQGANGIQGPTGADGKSAYQSAVEGGFAGTETVFISALSNIDNYASRVSGAVSGNIASLNSVGDLVDSGLKFSIYNGGLRITFDNGL